MALAGIEILCTIPLASYDLYLNASSGINPWVSWESVHFGFSRVDQFPAIEWQSFPVMRGSLEMTRWTFVICAFIFFAFFGFADEARKNYRSVLDSVTKRMGYSSTGTRTGIFSSNGYVALFPWLISNLSRKCSTGSTGSLPVYIHSETLRKKDSIGSLSSMSVSWKGEKDLNHFNEQHVMPAAAYESMTLPDLGGVLADHDSRSCSPPPSSGSSSSSSMNSPIDYPTQEGRRPISSMEISSIRQSYVDSMMPEPMILAPRHPADTPSSVTRDPIDIV